MDQINDKYLMNTDDIYILEFPPSMRYAGVYPIVFTYIDSSI